MSIEKQTQSITKVSIRDKVDIIYKQEMLIAVIGGLAVICLGIGCLFMQPFPGLLNVYIWGFPFPYWYQMTFNWLGMAILCYIISLLLKKNEGARQNLEKEE